MSHKFFINPESVLGTVARLFAADGAQLEVAVLTYSNPEIQETGYDNWNGGTTIFSLFLQVPITLYPQLESEKGSLEKSISEKLAIFLQGQENEVLGNVKIVPAVVDDPQWREKASAWLNGAKLTNQGRVRSSNVAPLTQDGLLFRSQPEIYLYKALKSLGVSFAPLPVFIRGGRIVQQNRT